MRNQWFISIKNNSGDIFDLSNLKHNYPKNGYYWADPFLYTKNNKHYLFYELYDYSKGVIACSEINEDLTLSDSVIVLERPYHISYPFLFEDNGELYMIPETGKNQSIELYKCLSFPNIWSLETVLVSNIIAGDTNIFKDENYYWMFTTAQPSLNDNLVIYVSDNLHSNWQKVAETYIRDSRSAGNIFKYKDQLIRPVQSGKNGYGSGIIFKSLDLNITKGLYDENIIHEIVTDWHSEIHGTHHFDFNEKYIVIDGKRKINY